MIMDQEKAKQLIADSIDSLPTLPDVVGKLITLVQDENTSASDLCTLISYDQAISLRLLKVANSAYYGFLKQVATIKHAIVILGFDEVKRLSLGIALFNCMEKTGSKTSLVMDDFWRHSVGSSLAAQGICTKLDVAGDIIPTASLLHDIGKLVVDNLFSGEYKIILEKAKAEELSTGTVEKEILGFSHADVGLWLGSKWQLPSSLILPIAYHHQVDEAEEGDLLPVSIVHLADIVCKKAGIGNSGDSTVPPFQQTAKEYLRLEDGEIDTLVEDLQKGEEKVQAFMNAIK
jgi:HD-like signal output (HDOD) protein